MNRIKVYLAAPLFNERERAFNEVLAGALSNHCDVFLPQRDGLLLSDLLAKGISTNVAETQIFERDCAALIECEMLLAVLDGAHIDEGVAFEIGFAHARGCLCLGLQTDIRRALPSGNNPMISMALSGIFNCVNELVAFIISEQSSCERSKIDSLNASQHSVLTSSFQA